MDRVRSFDFQRTVTCAGALAACVLLGLTGCADTRGSLATSAESLEHNAAALARDEPVGRDFPTDYPSEARALADEAREFRHVAEDHAARSEDVRAEFERLSHRYHALRDEVERSDSHEARADLRPVTDSYLDVERAIGGYPDRPYRVSENP